MENIRNAIGKFLHRLGISPNFITLLGLLFAGVAGFLIYEGRFFLAGSALLFSGILDLLDGATARASNNKHYFGAILDSSLDRYGDGFVLAGALFYCFEIQNLLYAALTLSALLGSFLISYVRARAECLIEKCRVGFWERGERIGCLVVGLLFNNLPMALLILGVGTHFTAIFRLYYADRQTIPFSQTASLSWLSSTFFHSSGRNNVYYYLKCALFFLILSLFRLPF